MSIVVHLRRETRMPFFIASYTKCAFLHAFSNLITYLCSRVIFFY